MSPQDFAPALDGALLSSRTRDRVLRRARANARTQAPVESDVRDPLFRPNAGPAKKIGKATLVAIVAAALHVLIFSMAIAANAIVEALNEEEPEAEEKIESVVVNPADKLPEPEKPPAEPEPEPLPAEPFESMVNPPTEVAAPQIGISEDSTVEGGTGPAFQTGTSLAGATTEGGLAQEILARDTKKQAPAEEMVMTGDTVDTQPRAMGSNRPPATPKKAISKRITGYVVVRMLIGKDGSVEDVKIMRSEPQGFFDEAVMEVVPGWRFSPATYKGQPVTLRVDQTIRFNQG